MTFDLNLDFFFLNSPLFPLNFFFGILLLLLSIIDSFCSSLQLILTFITLNSLVFAASFITSFYDFWSENWLFTVFEHVYWND